jgi:hypothetical protein
MVVRGPGAIRRLHGNEPVSGGSRRREVLGLTRRLKQGYPSEDDLPGIEDTRRSGLGKPSRDGAVPGLNSQFVPTHALGTLEISGLPGQPMEIQERRDGVAGGLRVVRFPGEASEAGGHTAVAGLVLRQRPDHAAARDGQRSDGVAETQRVAIDSLIATRTKTDHLRLDSGFAHLSEAKKS